MTRYELTIISPINKSFSELSYIEMTLDQYGKRVLRDHKESGVAKRLCYPINGQEFGRYLFYTFSMPDENKKKLIEELDFLCGDNRNGVIMRYLLVQKDTRRATTP